MPCRPCLQRCLLDQIIDARSVWAQTTTERAQVPERGGQFIGEFPITNHCSDPYKNATPTAVAAGAPEHIAVHRLTGVTRPQESLQCDRHPCSLCQARALPDHKSGPDSCWYVSREPLTFSMPP